MGMDQTANERTCLPCVVCGVLFDVKRKGAGALIRRRYTGDGRWLADGSCAGKTVEKKCEGIRPVVWRVFKQALQQQQKTASHGKDCLQQTDGLVGSVARRSGGADWLRIRGSINAISRAQLRPGQCSRWGLPVDYCTVDFVASSTFGSC